MSDVTHTSKRHWFVLGVLLLILTGLAGRRVFAQGQDGREYFPEKGHWVTGVFLEKYHSVPNPDELFGDPITDAFLDDTYGFTIQYFEKVRFEYHPEAIPDLRVKISPLGEFLYRKGQTLPDAFNHSGCHFYPNVPPGYYVCYDFLKFFEDNGGVAQFGYPISNFETHDGWIVQYFQRARFEWRPRSTAKNWVTLTDLGNQYFHIRNENPRRLNPNREYSIPPQSTIDIKVRAFVAAPIMPFSGTQTLYAIIQDQTNSPVENAELEFVIRYPGKDDQVLEMKPTNQHGISVIQFPVKTGTPGIIEIIVTGRYQTFEKQTKTSFQVWW